MPTIRTNYRRCHEQKWSIKIRGERRIRAYLNLSLAAAATTSTDYWKDGRTGGGDLHLVLRLHPPPARRAPPSCVPLPPVVWKNMFVFGEKSKGAATAATAADITRPRGSRSRRSRRAAAAAASPVARAAGSPVTQKQEAKEENILTHFSFFLLSSFTY